ncbi:uncharacterized protein LOC141587909 [Silene latifolia]|uniref:uncharacterized protein LOC141587909 n=1 Tax=Silene latifolia TaxID=37657 RepID=UPI003D78272E
MARRTPPKKTMEDEKKGKGKQSVCEGKEKVKSGVSFREPVERDEGEESDESEDISEETESSDEVEGEDSDDGEGSGDDEREDDGEKEKQVSQSDDGGLADMLSKVVKMAATMGAKKMTNDDTSTVDGDLKVAAVKKKVKGKEVEVGQGSKRKLTGGEVAVKKKRAKKEGTKLKGVEGHGSPASLHYVVTHLSTAQRKDVEDIGFGGLLELKASKFIHTMVDWLLDRYDTHTRLILFNRSVHFSICKHDVYDVFMLPCAGEDVPVGTEDKELVQSWRKRFVGSWKGNNSKSIGGCLMFFQLLYFHRLTWRGLPAPSTIPLIQHWTYDDLKRRVKEECKAYTVHRGFGIGVWDLKTYPVSLYLEKSFYRQTVENVVPEVEATVQDEARPAENSAAARTVSLPLPDDLPTDEDLRCSYSMIFVSMFCVGYNKHYMVDQALENVVPPPSFNLGIDDIGKEAPSRSYGLRYTRARDRPVPKPAAPVQSSTSDVTRATGRPIKAAGNKRK